jgi:hypothetical protein
LAATFKERGSSEDDLGLIWDRDQSGVQRGVEAEADTTVDQFSVDVSPSSVHRERLLLVGGATVISITIAFSCAYSSHRM